MNMLEFRISERVSFQPDGRGPVHGMLVRYNRKSVTDDGHRWNVSPSLLSKTMPPDAAPGGRSGGGKGPPATNIAISDPLPSQGQKQQRL